MGDGFRPTDRELMGDGFRPTAGCVRVCARWWRSGGWPGLGNLRWEPSAAHRSRSRSLGAKVPAPCVCTRTRTWFSATCSQRAGRTPRASRRYSTCKVKRRRGCTATTTSLALRYQRSGQRRTVADAATATASCPRSPRRSCALRTPLRGIGRAAATAGLWRARASQRQRQPPGLWTAPRVSAVPPARGVPP